MRNVTAHAVCLSTLILSYSDVRGQCTQSWTSEASLSVARQRSGVCTGPCGDIYALGGIASNIALSSVEVLSYDGMEYANAWITLSSMPTARDNPVVVCTNAYIYAIGGQDAGTQLASVDRYDITTSSWSSIQDLSDARTAAGGAVDAFGRIWVAGGFGSIAGTELDSVEIYDPARPGLGWVTGPPLTQARTQLSLVADEEGRLHAIGGAIDGVHFTSLERIDPCNSGGVWETLSATIPGTASNTENAVLGSDGRIYIAGGWLPGFSDRVIRFNPQSESFDQCTSMSVALNHVALTLGADQRVYRIGGEPSPLGATASVESLDTTDVCVSPVPAVSSIGLMVMVPLLLGVGVFILRRRQPVAV